MKTHKKTSASAKSKEDMAKEEKKSTGLATRTTTAVGKVMPSFLVGLEPDKDTMDMLSEYRILPRIKVVQAKSKQRDQYEEGDIVITPSNTLVCRDGESFDFIPLFFFPEFITWRDRNDKSGPPIMERSLDRAGALAGMAKDPERRDEGYGTKDTKKGTWQYTKRHTEHLCFIGLIRGDNTPVVLSFQRGEFNVGKQFINMIGMRKVNGVTAPMYTQVYTMTSADRDRKDNQWKGLDPNSAEDPWISEDEYPWIVELQEGLKKDYQAQNLGVNRKDEEEEHSSDTGDSATASEL